MSQSTSTDDGSESNEDQEESSSSQVANVESTLALFREKWQRELEVSPKRTPKTQESRHPAEDDAITIENKAKALFRAGIEHEQSGKFYEAIQFYKRAVQLVPDIEFRLYESSKPKVRERSETAEILEENDPNAGAGSDADSKDDGDFFTRITKIVYKNQRVCYPQFEQSTTHISALPMEIILYILRWVVSSELDLRSLEMFSRVCRGFYVSARDPEIWRLACVRAWGVNCGVFEPRYDSWRHMYLDRPRLRYNGCYISKTTYIRHGENSFQDQFYRPWHLIEYYRYLRFFPEGRVLMLTSTDEVQTCVNSLKTRMPRNQSALIGHYRLRDNYVTLVLKKQEIKGATNVFRRRRRDPIHDSGEQTFHVELEIQHFHKRANSQLTWKTYNIFTEYWNGEQSTARLSIVSGLYPSFKFSRVKSYSMESDSPLQ